MRTGARLTPLEWVGENLGTEVRKPATEMTSLIGWSVSGRLTTGGLLESEAFYTMYCCEV